MFLNRHVCEVNEHVLQLTRAAVVFHCAKTTKSKPVPDRYNKLVSIMHTEYADSVCCVHVCLEGSIAGDKNVETKVEFLASDEKRVF